MRRSSGGRRCHTLADRVNSRAGRCAQVWTYPQTNRDGERGDVIQRTHKVLLPGHRPREFTLRYGVCMAPHRKLLVRAGIVAVLGIVALSSPQAASGALPKVCEFGSPSCNGCWCVDDTKTCYEDWVNFCAVNCAPTTPKCQGASLDCAPGRLRVNCNYEK